MTTPNEVLINAYPKSGVTWLLHLVCDLLEGQHQDDERMEPRSYDHPVTSEWIVRKVHYPYWSQSIPILKNKTVVMTQRDPRDVVVSAMHYRKTTDLQQAIGVMVHSHYVNYLESWLKPGRPLKCKVVHTTYELLSNNPIPQLRDIALELTGETLTDERIEMALDRQSFPNMITQLNGDRHFMRKGIVGDWRNYFDREAAKMIDNYLGEYMLEQGYIEYRDWWRDV